MMTFNKLDLTKCMYYAFLIIVSVRLLGLLSDTFVLSYNISCEPQLLEILLIYNIIMLLDIIMFLRYDSNRIIINYYNTNIRRFTQYPLGYDGSFNLPIIHRIHISIQWLIRKANKNIAPLILECIFCICKHYIYLIQNYYICLFILIILLIIFLFLCNVRIFLTCRNNIIIVSYTII